MVQTVVPLLYIFMGGLEYNTNAIQLLVYYEDSTIQGEKDSAEYRQSNDSDNH